MNRASDLSLLRQAIEIRNEWLAHGLSTAPADRAAVEAAVTELYALVDAGPPRFVWVDSPAAAIPVLASGPAPVGLRAHALPDDAAAWPVASRLATLGSELRQRLGGFITRRLSHRSRAGPVPLDGLAPEDALRQGAHLGRLIETTVGASLETSLRDSVSAPLRTDYQRAFGATRHLTWYGQHEAHWVARYDAWRRLGLITVRARDGRLLDLWAALARHGGWWWPGEDVCVLSERPVQVHHEPLPGALHGQIRLHRDDGQVVRYRDGWGVHVLAGTHVPAWVITAPTVERIDGEPNIEIRRTAIERIGWQSYIDRAGLILVGAAPDPGNPGCELQLYDSPATAWTGRILLAVNGSLERDGHRRRYGLTVPADIDDPIEAAGWSYGLSRDLYARLARRT